MIAAVIRSQSRSKIRGRNKRVDVEDEMTSAVTSPPFTFSVFISVFLSIF